MDNPCNERLTIHSIGIKILKNGSMEQQNDQIIIFVHIYNDI